MSDWVFLTIRRTPRPPEARKQSVDLGDADATPRPVRDVLLGASSRRNALPVFVANIGCVCRLPQVRFVQVPKGPDEADKYIAERQPAISSRRRRLPRRWCLGASR